MRLLLVKIRILSSELRHRVVWYPPTRLRDDVTQKP